MKLRHSMLAADPFQQFEIWHKAWREMTTGDPTVVTLATASAGGEPSARVVLLKGWGPEGFVFYTNRESRKGRDLADNPRAALCFYWPEAGHQVRVRGTVAEVERDIAREYFHSRPRGSQLGGMVSQQSRPAADDDQLAEAVREARLAFDGREIPLPDHWGGYRITPTAFEFWQNGLDRLHDRFQYRLEAGVWVMERLQP